MMSVSPTSAARHLRSLESQRRAVDEARADGLRTLLPQAADLLRALGATEVWAFGSLVAGGVHADSDVDLAVAGLDDSGWARALGALDALIPAPVDLVLLERATPGFASRIRREGQAL